MYRRAILCLMVGIAGCGGVVETGGSTGPDSCDPIEWQSFDPPVIAAEGAYAPFHPSDYLAAPLPPVDARRTLTAITIGLAPGWGCKAPHAVGVWLGEEGDKEPAALVTLPAEGEDTDLGDGFAVRRIALSTPLEVPAGEVAWLAAGIEGAECGAKAQGPNDGARHWRPDLGWQIVDGRLVMGAEGCEGD